MIVNTYQKTSYPELLSYFLPIALQAASQSVTYPLVGVIASNGAGGPLELAGLAQSNSIMFLIGTFGAGLVTTGMVFGNTKEGFRQFIRINYLITLIVFLIQGFCAIPGVSHLLFSGIMGLPESLEDYSTRAFAATLPLHVLFFMRNPYQVILYLKKETFAASLATIARILFTLSITPVFCYLNLAGVIWASVALALGVFLEVLLSWLFARKHIINLDYITSKIPTVKDLFGFTIPLSLGALFLSLSNVIIGMVIGRAKDAEHLMPVFYLALGIANPMAYAATRNQTLAVIFSKPCEKNPRVFTFAIYSGILLGLIPLLLILPGIIDLYYVNLQNASHAQVHYIRITAICLLLHPLGVALRSYCEGVAANRKKTGKILTGQAVYLAVLSVTAVSALLLGVSGNIIGPVSLIVSNIAAASVIQLSLDFKEKRNPGLALVKNTIPLPEMDKI